MLNPFSFCINLKDLLVQFIRTEVFPNASKKCPICLAGLLCSVLVALAMAGFQWCLSIAVKHLGILWD